MGWIGRSIVGMALALIVGSFLAPVAYVVHLAGRSGLVDREIERIRQSGEPVSMADLAGKPIPASQNAAHVYAKCFEAFPRFGSGYRRRSTRSGSFYRFDGSTRDPRQWADARAYLKSYAGVLDTAEKAAAMPKCRYPISKDVAVGSRHLRGIRQLNRLALIQALVNARDGDSGSAIKHLALAFRIADSLAEDRTTNGQGARLSAIRNSAEAIVRVASLARVSEHEARWLSDVISRIDVSNYTRNILEEKRALAIAFYENVSCGREPTMDTTEHVSTGKAFRKMCSSMPGKTWLYSDELFYLRQMRRYLDIADLPYRSLMETRRDEPPRPPRYALFSTVLLPRLDQLAKEVDRCKSSLAGSRIFLGLLAYRDRFGVYPDDLNDLRERLDWEVPDDPFSGKPFVYRRQGRGFVFYAESEYLKNEGAVRETRTTPGDLVWSIEK